jgi:hypothetical protein
MRRISSGRSKKRFVLVTMVRVECEVFRAFAMISLAELVLKNEGESGIA